MTRPDVTCCEPELHFAWFHAPGCKAGKGGEKIRRAPAKETRHLRIVQRGEDVRAAVPTIVPRGAVHPPCKALAEDGMPERVHAECAWRLGLDTPLAQYFAFHMDDGR